MKPFSIIIPTLNRTDYLLGTLKDLIKQEYKPGFEILIIDQSHQIDDNVKDFIKPYPFIYYHFITHFKGLPEARNYGAKTAKNPYLLFIDDDVQCRTNLLAEHAKALQLENVAVVAGGITEKNKKNAGERTGAFVKWSATPLRGFHLKRNSNRYVSHAGGGNFSIKKNIYVEIGGVDEQLSKGAALYEETDLCLRVIKAKYFVYFNYDAHVVHLAADTGGCRVPEIDKYIFSMSRNRSIIIKRHLPFYYQVSANIYLIRLVLSYSLSYRTTSVWNSYFKGIKEGRLIGKKSVKNEFIK